MVSDAFLSIVTATALVYFDLLKDKVRIWRLLGSLAIIIVTLGGAMVEDSAPLFIMFGVGVIVGIKYLTKELPALGNNEKQ